MAPRIRVETAKADKELVLGEILALGKKGGKPLIGQRTHLSCGKGLSDFE